MVHLSRWIGAITASLMIVVSASAASAQTQSVGTTGAADPAPVLWKDPGPVASRDLFWGPGSEARAPKGPFTFVKENSGGTQPKIVVTDANGVTWDVKFGPEVHAEIAASRLIHALGYFAEETYFVRSGLVQGADGLDRAAPHVSAAGTFARARFTRQDPQVVDAEQEWTFHENPFAGTKELSGLLILMTMVNNWDIRGAANNDVVRATTADGRSEVRYLVGDLGATFGRMGGRISARSKWKLQDYQAEGFIEKVEEGVLHLDYDGLDSGMDRVPVEHARWFAALASQLTPDQVRRAFEAAGAGPEEVAGFSKRFMEKVAELQAAVK